MHVIVSHGSVLRLLRRGGRLAPANPADVPAAPSERPPRGETAAAIRRARAALEKARLLDAHHVLDVLVRPGDTRPHQPLVREHQWTSPTDPPLRRLVLPLDEGAPAIYVVAPELLFVQAASRLTLERTVLLGWELCGRYGKVMKGDVREELVAQGFEKRDPLTRVERLQGFLGSMPNGLYGSKRAREALTYVRDGARSPMEAAVAFLLCAPPELGGFGLPAPLVNHSVPLSPRAAALTLEASLELDLYWEDPPLDVEVYGHAWHGGSKSKKQAARDAVRNNELERQKIPRIHLAGEELTNWRRFKLNALNIAAELQVVPQIEDPAWEQRYRDLHAVAMNLVRPAVA